MALLSLLLEPHPPLAPPPALGSLPEEPHPPPPLFPDPPLLSFPPPPPLLFPHPPPLLFPHPPPLLFPHPPPLLSPHPPPPLPPPPHPLSALVVSPAPHPPLSPDVSFAGCSGSLLIFWPQPKDGVLGSIDWRVSLDSSMPRRLKRGFEPVENPKEPLPCALSDEGVAASHSG